MPLGNGALLTALHGVVFGGLFLLAYSGGCSACTACVPAGSP